MKEGGGGGCESFVGMKEVGDHLRNYQGCLLWWEEAYQLLEEIKTNKITNTHQVIGSMIKGDYDDEFNWQMVEYILDRYIFEGYGFGLRLYNAILDALWWLGKKAWAAHVHHEETRHALFPELFRQSKLVWSVDVHSCGVLFLELLTGMHPIWHGKNIIRELGMASGLETLCG